MKKNILKRALWSLLLTLGFLLLSLFVPATISRPADLDCFKFGLPLGFVVQSTSLVLNENIYPIRVFPQFFSENVETVFDWGAFGISFAIAFAVIFAISLWTLFKKKK